MQDSTKLLLISAAIYLLTSLTAYILYLELGASQALPTQAQQQQTGNNDLWYFFLILVIITLIFWRFKHSTKLARFVKILYFFYIPFMLAFFAFVITSIWLPFLSLGLNTTISLMAAILMAILYFKKKQKFFNLFGAIIAIGAGAFLSIQLLPIYALALLALFSIYDLIAVFGTKHMITLSNLAIQHELPLMLIMGDMKQMKEYAQGYRCRNCFALMDETYEGINDKEREFECPNCHRYVRLKDGRDIVLREGDSAKEKKEKAFMGLGIGDLLLPALVPATFLILNPYNPIWLFLIAACVVGLYIDFRIVKKYRKPIPALPMIALVCFLVAGIGYLIGA